MFLDGACPIIKERDECKWSIRLFSPGYNISWNANYEEEAAYSSAQWTLGEDFQFDGEKDLSSFTLSNDLVKLEVEPIPSSSKTPYVHPLIMKDFVGWVSDKGVIIQYVDLLNAQNSNRYSRDIETRQDGETFWVSTQEDGWVLSRTP